MCGLENNKKMICAYVQDRCKVFNKNFYVHIICVCICVSMLAYVPPFMCGGERTISGAASLSTLFETMSFLFCFTFSVCIRACMCTYHTIYMWRSEDNLWNSVLSFHHVGPRDEIQVMTPGA